MEKSLVSFMANYPSWQPDAAAKQLLNSLANQPLQRTPHFPYTAHVDQLASSTIPHPPSTLPIVVFKTCSW
jgi:hypothetical protein